MASEEAEQEITAAEAQAQDLSGESELAYTPAPDAEPLFENQSNMGLNNRALPAPPAPNPAFQTQSSKMRLLPAGQDEQERAFVADVPQTLVSEAPPSDERLGAVYSPASQYENEAQVLAALLAVLQTDPSPNVRIAAIDALERFIQSPEVRQQLCESLLGQDSPTTQMATIDVLVKYQIREGVVVLRRFLTQRNLNATVREQAQLALEILS
ncbi:MAG: HEAT repeat domain-containing protein [Microscillaceae bacterium]|nr:HEAT repeat domain-containing protein [Microscillaceae bacterium]